MQVYTANNGCQFIILEQQGKQCVVQFLETGYVRRANWDNLKVGKVKDLYAKCSYGVGYLGEYKRTGYHVPAQQLWRNMIKRCYYSGDPKGYMDKGTTVDPRWHCFADFLEDLPELPNFKAWVNKEGVQLDKDLRVPGANVYSKETCSFISEAENKAAGKRDKRLIDGQWVTTSA